MITLMDKLYIVSFCHGEYGGHVKLPIVVCTTYDEAEFFIHDVIQNWDKYKDVKICNQLTDFDWEFKHNQIFDYNFDIDPIPVYQV